MLDVNPFAELSALLSPAILQGYIVLMFILVVVGTILDMAHKKSAQYFFENAEKAQKHNKLHFLQDLFSLKSIKKFLKYYKS